MWGRHKLECRRQPSNSVTATNANVSQGNGSDGDKMRLEVLSGSGEWRDAGPINVLNDVSKLDIACNPSPPNVHKEAEQTQHLIKVLPSSVRSYLKNNNYRYRNSQDGIDTNMMIFLHGAGDTHEPFDKLAKKMQLAQTATLAITARNIALPLDLGYTWFEEMDGIGNPLVDEDERRLSSLSRAVDWLENLLCLLIRPGARNGANDNNAMMWIPERIFLLGFSAGACLAMELCQKWRAYGRLALGGAICIAGGIKTKFEQRKTQIAMVDNTTNEATHVLIVSGSNDKTFSQQAAAKSKQLYDSPSKVQLHVERGKGHSMIGSRSEMTIVMEFLSKRMVRRMISMENMT